MFNKRPASVNPDIYQVEDASYSEELPPEPPEGYGEYEEEILQIIVTDNGGDHLMISIDASQNVDVENEYIVVDLLDLAVSVHGYKLVEND